jgi:hypothetical protein
MRLGSTPGSLKFFCWSSIFAWGICMALFWMAWRAAFLLELHFCMGNLHGAVLDGVARGRALWPLGAFQYQFFH